MKCHATLKTFRRSRIFIKEVGKLTGFQRGQAPP